MVFEVVRGPCARRVVRATIVLPDGRRFTGENSCLSPQPSCPCGGMPSGVGYELCRLVCLQPAHAEVAALEDAELSLAWTGEVPALKGATCYVEGHHYACADCVRRLSERGVLGLVFGPAP